MDREEHLSDNRRLAQWRIKCLYDSLVQGSRFVFQMDICAKNPPLRQAPDRCNQFMKTILLNIIIAFGLLISCDFKTTDQYFNDACKKEEQGDYEGAIKDLDIVLKRNPNDIEALINRAVDKKALGRYDEAMLEMIKQ